MIDSPDALKELLPNVSRETIEKLAEFREIILAEDQNLISKNDKDFIWTRHFYDSLRLAQFITSNGNDIIDIGSGAGLPGIPCLLYTSPSPRDDISSRMPSSA